MTTLLDKFITSFQKAVASEMAAMRERLGPFEVQLTNGHLLETTTEGVRHHTFDIVTPNDKLILHSECSFEGGGVEFLVTIASLTEKTVTLEGEHLLPSSAEDARLVIYPWFLYERLQDTLNGLKETTHYNIKSAMRLFGKEKASLIKNQKSSKLPSLNDGQSKAVNLCSAANLAFVWGPPGTGKTTTLAHIVLGLLSEGHRILVTSTTNAAVDQVLAKLHSLIEGKELLGDGSVVRVGHTSSPTFGASLREVAKRSDAKNQEKMERLLRLRPVLEKKASACQVLLKQLKEASGPKQLSLFGPATADTLTSSDLLQVFGRGLTKKMLQMTESVQERIIRSRKGRLEAALELSLDALTTARSSLRNQEQAVLGQARVILATMTNMYINKLLRQERFDVVVVEEAGMAILPTLFYCATLARKKTIMIGDPRQLPPIVQSSADYVRKAMGRSIFEVTVPKPHESEFVALLDRQYRMHPLIGDLVSNLFYDGRLLNDEVTKERSTISNRPPFPKEALVLFDTQDGGVCKTQQGAYSRFNEHSAKLCVNLAKEALDGGLESIAIIAPYAEQIRLIGRMIRQQFSSGERERLECRTVHRFQGNERDLVIFDTVDTSPLKPGILLSDKRPGSSAKNLVNVSISRARGKLIVVTDKNYFSTFAPQSIIDKLAKEITLHGVCKQTV